MDNNSKMDEEEVKVLVKEEYKDVFKLLDEASESEEKLNEICRDKDKWRIIDERNKEFSDPLLGPPNTRELIGLLAANDLEFSEWDPGWIKALYARGEALLTNKKFYKWDEGPTSEIYKLPQNCDIALVGDIGTSNDHHRRLLEAVVLQKPDMVLHLGDIYYSGDYNECRQFMGIYRKYLDEVPIWSIPGNHEYISYGRGFYNLLDDDCFGYKNQSQKKSFFCLSNDDVQLVGLDTGFMSHNFDFRRRYGDEKGRYTKLEETELRWLQNIMQRKNCPPKTLWFTHHPFFSASWSTSQINEQINDQLKKSNINLNQVNAWFWGDEHRLLIYKDTSSFCGLKRGRCVGCGTMPELSQHATYSDFQGELKNHLEDVKLGRIGKTSGFTTFKRGFAMLHIRGKNVTVKYYEIDQPSLPLNVREIKVESF